MGARNAGHLAAEILALSDAELAGRVQARRRELAARVQLPEGFQP
jgi:phosphoribosylcarboxyaminoimidazole (NCAIR) mutase